MRQTNKKQTSTLPARISNNPINNSFQIIDSDYSDVMKKSYIDYSMSVITSRALPDIRDGLKPVQRRVIYAMNQLGLDYNKPYRKSARIVGDTMGKYHPHGDSSIYETMVVMSQDFKKSVPLVDGHGNFGSIEGDGAAAQRYTEVRLRKFTQDVFLTDLSKDIVTYNANFDNTDIEPEILPAKVCNFLVNGSEGIAVGMTTNTPPHNLGEVIDAEIAYLKNENITIDKIMDYLPGPDFPTGGIVVNKDMLNTIYETGVGKIKIRGKIEFESGTSNEHDKLVITEIPYTMIGAGISKFLSDTIALINDKVIDGVTDISNESSKEGIRIVLHLKKNVDIENLKNCLYQKTKLEDTFGVNMLAIFNGRPETLNIKQILKIHTDFYYEVLHKKYIKLLNKRLEDKEIKEGLIKAYDIIDLILAVLRGSKNIRDAKSCLMNGDTINIQFKTKTLEARAKKLNFTEKQASAILDMRLHRLVGLEINALKKEYEIILKEIAKYQRMLNNKKELQKQMIMELIQLKSEYSVPRKTTLTNENEISFIKNEFISRDVTVLINKFGYIKLIDKQFLEKDKDSFSEIKYIINTTTSDTLMIFTDTGVLHQIKIEDIPFTTKSKDKGIPLDNISNFSSSKENSILITSKSGIEDKNLIFVTENGLVKVVSYNEFMTTRKTILATKLNTDDKVFTIIPFIKDELLFIKTVMGYVLCFPISEISIMKKKSTGVCGILLNTNDKITECKAILQPPKNIRKSHRGKKGVKPKNP